MTANDNSACGGPKSDDCTAQSDGFENWARKEIATQLTLRAEDALEAIREISESVREGEDVDPEQITAFRNQQRELHRVFDGVLLAAGCEFRPDRETAAGQVHDAGTEVHDAALKVDRLVLNEEPVTEHDVEMVRSYADSLHKSMDDIVRCYQGYDK